MRTQVYSASDLKIETKKETFTYPKGSLIQLEVGTSEDVYVVHHRLKEEERKSGDACAKSGKAGSLQMKSPSGGGAPKLVCVVPGMESYESYDYTPTMGIQTSYLKFLRMEDLKFFSDAVILESQINPSVDFKEFALEDALLSERLSPSLISRYLNETSSSLEKLFMKDNKTFIRLPVQTRSKVLTVTEKVAALSGYEKIDDSQVKPDDILAVSARKEGNSNETGYLVSTRMMSEGIDRALQGYLVGKLKSALPNGWTIRVNEGHTIVQPNGDRPAQMMTILKQLPVSLEVNKHVKDGLEFYEVSILEGDQEEVVESFYTRETAYSKYELLEADDKTPEEGDDCQSDGKKGVLQKQGDALVCVVKESMTPEFDEDIHEGDPCADNEGYAGTVKFYEGNLCCMVPRKTVTESGTQFTEEVAFIIPVNEAEFGASQGDSASPAPGDPCDYSGQTGTLQLINGALICALGGEPPRGADGAN
jgi:hypothetical protein